jgi:hypothetical protein
MDRCASTPFGTETARSYLRVVSWHIDRNAPMPTLADLQVRFGAPRSSQVPLVGADEVLVTDARGKLSPAQMVEQKLRRALHTGRCLIATSTSGPRQRRKSD